MDQIGKIAWKNRDVLVPFYELFTAPASHILDRWFESEILKTTLATDAVIGALCSPKHAGSAYVLLHHVMGEAAGRQGVWAYVQVSSKFHITTNKIQTVHHQQWVLMVGEEKSNSLAILCVFEIGRHGCYLQCHCCQCS